MKVILLSMLLGENASKAYKEKGLFLNPAGQNFYSRFYASLKQRLDVKAFSPVHEEAQDEGFTYIKTPSKMFNKAKIIAEIVTSYIQKEGISAVFFDSLNVTLAKASSIIRKKTNIKTIGICTDDPRNISNTNFLYPSLCLGYGKKADAYYCLTQGLNDLFNVHHKPHLIRMGILENMEGVKKIMHSPYIYFGGALYERYGILDLIHAYEKSSPDYDLLISGHGPLNETVRNISNPRIHFLGLLSKQEHLSYVKGASIVINPRRFDTHLDPYSVPSKVLENIALSKYVVTTLSSPIKEKYPANLNWIAPNKDNEQALIDFFNEHLNSERHFVNLVENTEMASIQKDLGIESTSFAIVDLLNQLF